MKPSTNSWNKTLTATLAVMASAFALGCGSREPDAGSGGAGGGGAGGNGGPAGERYMPLRLGAGWTYRVTDVATGVVSAKTNVVEAREDVGGRKAGVMAFRIRVDKDKEDTLTWQEDRGSSLLRHLDRNYDPTGRMKSETWYEPYEMRLDEAADHLAMGATWVETRTETQIKADGTTKSESKSSRWTIEAVGESLTVPAGTFQTLRAHRVSVTGSSDKMYWFARGVGKIKETGDQTEELSSFVLP